MVERPAQRHGYRDQSQIGVDRVGMAHRVKERQVEDAVGVGIRGAQLAAVIGGPLTGCRALAHTPDEAAVEPARVPPVGLLVAGGDHPVETEGVGEGSHQVGGRSRREDERTTRLPVGREGLERERLDEVDERFDRPFAGPTGPVRRAASHDRRGGPGQCDEGYRLPEDVVEPVEQPVTGQVPAFVDDPFGLHRVVEDRPARRADERAVEVDEDGTPLLAHALTLPIAFRAAGGHGARFGPGRGEGTAGGEAVPSL